MAQDREPVYEAVSRHQVDPGPEHLPVDPVPGQLTVVDQEEHLASPVQLVNTPAQVQQLNPPHIYHFDI